MISLRVSVEKECKLADAGYSMLQTSECTRCVQKIHTAWYGKHAHTMKMYNWCDKERLQRGLIRASKRRQEGELETNQEQQHALWTRNVPTGVAILVSAALMLPEICQASDSWVPRRHYRGIKKESSMDRMIRKNELRKQKGKNLHKKKSVHANGLELQSLKEKGETDGMLDASVKYLRDKYDENFGSKKPMFSVGVSGSNVDPRMYYHGSHHRMQQPEASPLGSLILWGLAALGVFMFVQKKTGFTFGLNRGKKGKKGKWVRDRSLGGKMIFIEEPEATKPGSRPLWGDLPGEEEFRAPPKSPPYSISQETVTTQKAALWWSPPPEVKFVSETRKGELQSEAQRIVRQMENRKVESGEDYSLQSLLSLRSACQKGGGLTVKTRTQSGRDSMLRMAFRYSLEYPKSMFGDYEPSRFVTGIAMDLQVPTERAVTIVHSEIASICRSSLIDAEAAFRAKDENLMLDSLSRVLYALDCFPMAPGTPQIEMVGRSIIQQTSLEFRKSVFFAAGARDVSIAPVIAEMVGFDPQLVMPQLNLYMQGAKEEME